MALTDENGGGIPATMLVSPSSFGGAPYPVYMGGPSGGGNSGGWDNGNGWWIILLFILLASGNWGNNGNGGGAFGGAPIVVNDGGGSVQRGFDQAATMSGINGIQTGIYGLSTQLCNCCGDIQSSLCNGFAGVNATVNSVASNAETAANARAMANMQQLYGLSSQFADCCCENRLGIADLKYTVAQENCLDRQALSDGIRDVIAAQTAGFQSIKDELYRDRLDEKDDTIAQLRQEVLFARGQASQIAQNSTIIDGIYSRLDSCPVGTTPVFGRTPIFTCNTNCGCGCGNNNGCGCGNF